MLSGGRTSILLDVVGQHNYTCDIEPEIIHSVIVSIVTMVLR